MQILGNICGGLFVLAVLAGLYLAAGNMLGIIGRIEDWSSDQELLDAERLILGLPRLPLVVRWVLLLIGPLLFPLIGTVLIGEAMIRLERDLIGLKASKAKGSAR